MSKPTTVAAAALVGLALGAGLYWLINAIVITPPGPPGSKPPLPLSDPQLAMDSAGNAMAVWT